MLHPVPSVARAGAGKCCLSRYLLAVLQSGHDPVFSLSASHNISFFTIKTHLLRGLFFKKLTSLESSLLKNRPLRRAVYIKQTSHEMSRGRSHKNSIPKQCPAVYNACYCLICCDLVFKKTGTCSLSAS